VDTVISGELARSGGVLFLRTELVDVSDGSQLCGAYAEYPDVSGRMLTKNWQTGS
jgi:hypothetical protein